MAGVLAAGELFISRGMLRAAVTDSQLAAVVAHELGHLVAGHIRERANVAYFLGHLSVPLWPVIIPGGIAISAAAFLGEVVIFPELLVLIVPAAIMSSPVILATLYIRRESRKQEYEADLMGLCLMSDAGYDVDAALAIMQRVGDFERQAAVNAERSHTHAAAGGLLTTHPAVSASLADMSCRY